MTRSTSAPPEVERMAAQRAAARAGGDYTTADALRDDLAALGWFVVDGPGGYTVTALPPYDALDSVAAMPDSSAEPAARAASVHLIVEGWPDDLRRCLDALLEHLPPDVGVVALDVGDVDGAGAALHEYADAQPERLTAWHVRRPAGWGSARTALLRADPSAVHVWMETSTVVEGDVVSPLLAALEQPGVVGAGWRGVDVDLADDWRSFRPAGAGEVDALLGYLVALRRDAVLAVGGPHPKARFYRNADLELSLLLRETGGRLVAVPDLPVRQERHRGYADSDPEYRERESRRTYDRLLRRFRGRTDLLAPRA